MRPVQSSGSRRPWAAALRSAFRRCHRHRGRARGRRASGAGPVVRSGRSRRRRPWPNQRTPVAGPRLSFADDGDHPALRRPEHDRAAASTSSSSGPAPHSAGRSTTPRTASCTRCDLDVARREHDAFVERPRAPRADGPRPRRGDSTTRTSSTPSIRCSSPIAAPSRCVRASRTGQGEPAVLEAWTTTAGHPDRRPDRGAGHDRGRRHVLAPARPVLHRPDAAHERAAVSRQLADLVGGDVRVFDVPYWKGPAELIHLMSVISPVADDLAVVYLPLLPVGLWELLGRPGDPAGRGARRGVPDPRLQRAGGPARSRDHGRGQPGDGRRALAAAGCEVHTYAGDPDRRQRLGRPDLHDPTDPA